MIAEGLSGEICLLLVARKEVGGEWGRNKSYHSKGSHQWPTSLKEPSFPKVSNASQ